MLLDDLTKTAIRFHPGLHDVNSERRQPLGEVGHQDSTSTAGAACGAAAALRAVRAR